MQTTILNAIRSNFLRAVATVASRHGEPQMDTSVCEEIWAEMIGTPAMPEPPAIVRQGLTIRTVQDELLAAAPAAQVEEFNGGMGGTFATPKRPTKPVEPMAPERQVKPADEESVAGSEEKEDTKLTPQQRLEKQKRTTTDKLDKLRARQGTAKQNAKQKEADPKEIAKLEEKLKEIDGKLEKFVAKAAKPNFEKWTPTWTKHFKTAADAAKMEVDDDTKAGLVQFVNSLTPEAFKKGAILEHAQAYFKQRAAAGVGLVPDASAKKPEPEEEDEAGETQDYKGRAADVVAAEAEPDADEENYEVTYDGELFLVGETSRAVFRAGEGDAADERVRDLDTVAAVLKKLDKQLAK